jgi:DNA-binding transcriptional LysR family regulator
MNLFDIDQLRTFIAIADTGSFTRAAEIVHKTQSAVSMQMKRLEERVGKAVFERDGRGNRLTDDGERLLDYARRIVKLSTEAVIAFNEGDLHGRVCLGVPDDYAERYLPEILARFARSHPRVEVNVICEPSSMLCERIAEGSLDLAIITHTDSQGPAEIIRQEQLLWVTSSRHGVHDETPLPLALGRPNCCWRRVALDGLEGIGRRYRVAYTSWNSNAVVAAMFAGLAVSVLPESALRPGIRVLGPADGFPPLPSCRIALLRSRHGRSNQADALAAHIVASLDNLSEALVAAE